MEINRRGLFGTISVHGLILLLLIIGGLTFPDPPPEEEGVLVNFGTDDTGFGQTEPAGNAVEQNIPVPEVEPADNTVQETEESYIPEETVPEETITDNTQDVEEVKVKEDPQPTAEELQKEREDEQRIQREQEEAERIRKEQEEAERIRQEEEAERLRQEEEQRQRDEQANRLNNLGKNTFGNQGVGESEGSEGVNPGDGNQGVETGSPGADNYGDGSGLGDGYSYGGMGTRKVAGKLPLPNVDNCNVTSRIVVTVDIQVDRDGNVTSAVRGKGTYDDNCIWSQVIAAAKKTKFTADQNDSFKRAGWIQYTIEP